MHLKKLWNAINLQFQKFETMLINDIRLFLRDKKSLILVVLTPFLILSILINIFYFSSVAETIRGVKLGVCDMDESGFDLESNMFKLYMLEKGCNETVEQLVSEGDLRGAVIIPKDFKKDIEDGKGTELKLFVDNSKSTTAIVTTNAIKAYVSDLNEQIGTKFILEAWKNLNELNDNLKFLVKNLEKATPTARTMLDKLDTINSEISSIDFEENHQVLSDVILLLDLLEKEFLFIDNNLANISIPIISTFDDLSNDTVSLKTYSIQIEKLREKYCDSTGLLGLIDNPACVVLDTADSLISGISSEVSNTSTKRYEINKVISELNTELFVLNETLTRLSVLTGSGTKRNEELREKLTILKDNLIFLENKSQNLTSSLVELNQSARLFLGDVIRITDELNKTIQILDEYTQKDPSTILRPVKVEIEPVFKDKLEIFYKLPALMSILLLFITLFISSSLIVKERQGGTMARIFLSPISMFFYVFEKTVFLLLLCIMSIVFMFIATAVFNVFIPLSLDLLLVMLVASLAYISIGVLIGATSKSENTSLLTCLVIGFPLMFLSGAFSPPELMGNIIRSVAQYLPLTLNVSLIENIIIYNTGIDVLNLGIIVGMIFIFYLLSVLMIRKNPTLK